MSSQMRSAMLGVMLKYVSYLLENSLDVSVRRRKGMLIWNRKIFILGHITKKEVVDVDNVENVKPSKKRKNEFKEE